MARNYLVVWGVLLSSRLLFNSSGGWWLKLHLLVLPGIYCYYSVRRKILKADGFRIMLDTFSLRWKDSLSGLLSVTGVFCWEWSRRGLPYKCRTLLNANSLHSLVNNGMWTTRPAFIIGAHSKRHYNLWPSNFDFGLPPEDGNRK